MCGGIAPIGGNTEILYDCSPARHRVRQLHLPAGMQPRLPEGPAERPHVQRLLRHQRAECDRRQPTTTSSAATMCPLRSSPRPPVTIPTTGVPRVISIGCQLPAASRPTTSAASTSRRGATSMPFDVATSYVPHDRVRRRHRFLVRRRHPSVPDHERTGRACLGWRCCRPSPPPAQPIPTPVQFKIVGLDPVTGGQHSLGQVHTERHPARHRTDDHVHQQPPADRAGAGQRHASGEQPARIRRGHRDAAARGRYRCDDHRLGRPLQLQRRPEVLNPPPRAGARRRVGQSRPAWSAATPRREP